MVLDTICQSIKFKSTPFVAAASPSMLPVSQLAAVIYHPTNLSRWRRLRTKRNLTSRWDWWECHNGDALLCGIVDGSHRLSLLFLAQGSRHPMRHNPPRLSMLIYSPTWRQCLGHRDASRRTRAIAHLHKEFSMIVRRFLRTQLLYFSMARISRRSTSLCSI